MIYDVLKKHFSLSAYIKYSKCDSVCTEISMEIILLQ